MSSRKCISLYKNLIVRGTIEEINAKESNPFRRPTEALTNDVIGVDSISCFFFFFNLISSIVLKNGNAQYVITAVTFCAKSALVLAIGSFCVCNAV